jgi:hypothetical protein
MTCLDQNWIRLDSETFDLTESEVVNTWVPSTLGNPGSMETI